MDIPKIFLGLFVLFGVLLIILQGRIKLLFWLGVLLMFSRRISFPYLGEIEPSTLILGFTALLVAPPVLSYLIRNYPIQLFVLLLGLAVAFFIHSPADEVWIWSFSVFSVYLMCALSDLFIRTEADIERLSTYFIVISFIIAFTAIIAYAGFADGVILLSDKSAVNMDDGSVTYSRTYGIAYSNTVNGFIPIALIFLYSKKWPKILKAVLFLVIAASVFISLKRLAYISLLLSLLYIVFREGKRPQWKIVLLFGALMAGGVFFFGQTIIERFQNTESALSGDASPDNNRTVRIQYAWNQYKKTPVLGAGSGYVTYVHNGYLEILTDLGIPGLFILVPWVYRPLRSFWHRTDRRLSDWAAGSLIYLGTLFLFEAVLNEQDLFWIFGLLYAGFECAQRIYGPGNAEQNNMTWKKERLALP